jgi:hypothetical protein
MYPLSLSGAPGIAVLSFWSIWSPRVWGRFQLSYITYLRTKTEIFSAKRLHSRRLQGSQMQGDTGWIAVAHPINDAFENILATWYQPFTDASDDCAHWFTVKCHWSVGWTRGYDVTRCRAVVGWGSHSVGGVAAGVKRSYGVHSFCGLKGQLQAIINLYGNFLPPPHGRKSIVRELVAVQRLPVGAESIVFPEFICSLLSRNFHYKAKRLRCSWTMIK